MGQFQTFGDAPELARALVRRFGFELGHLYAFARHHPHVHHGAVGDEHTRLEWGRVVAQIERAYARHLRAEQGRERKQLLGRRRSRLDLTRRA